MACFPRQRNPGLLPAGCLRLLLVIALVGLVSPTADAHHPDHLACQVKERREGRLLLRGCAHAENLQVGALGAREFLDHHAAGLGLQPGLADIQLVDERQSTAGFHTRFRQTLVGIPVYGAAISVNQAGDGALQSLYSDYRPLAPGNPFPTLSAGEAEAVASAAAGVQATRLPSSSELVWYPRANGSTALHAAISHEWRTDCARRILDTGGEGLCQHVDAICTISRRFF